MIRREPRKGSLHCQDERRRRVSEDARRNDGRVIRRKVHENRSGEFPRRSISAVTRNVMRLRAWGGERNRQSRQIAQQNGTEIVPNELAREPAECAAERSVWRHGAHSRVAA